VGTWDCGWDWDWEGEGEGGSQSALAGGVGLGRCESASLPASLRVCEFARRGESFPSPSSANCLTGQQDGWQDGLPPWMMGQPPPPGYHLPYLYCYLCFRCSAAAVLYGTAFPLQCSPLAQVPRTWSWTPRLLGSFPERAPRGGSEVRTVGRRSARAGGLGLLWFSLASYPHAKRTSHPDTPGSQCLTDQTCCAALQLTQLAK
jgi:hypothetical protein